MQTIKAALQETAGLTRTGGFSVIPQSTQETARQLFSKENLPALDPYEEEELLLITASLLRWVVSLRRETLEIEFLLEGDTPTTTGAAVVTGVVSKGVVILGPNQDLNGFQCKLAALVRNEYRRWVTEVKNRHPKHYEALKNPHRGTDSYFEVLPPETEQPD